MSTEKKEEACLFSEGQVQQIEQKYKEWFENSLRDSDRKTEGHCHTHSGIPLKLIHTPADIKHLDYTTDIGFSGQPPFVRGVYPNMYRGRPFTVRQLAGLGAPEDCNLRIKYLLDHGATGVNILFDLPTIRDTAHAGRLTWRYHVLRHLKLAVDPPPIAPAQLGNPDPA